MKLKFLIMYSLFAISGFSYSEEVIYFDGLNNPETTKLTKLFYDDGNFENIKQGLKPSQAYRDACESVGVEFRSESFIEQNVQRAADCHQKLLGNAYLKEFNLPLVNAASLDIPLPKKTVSNFTPIENSCTCEGSALICSLGEGDSCNKLDNTILKDQDSSLGEVLSRVALEQTTMSDRFQLVVGTQDFCSKCIDQMADTKKKFFRFLNDKKKLSDYNDLKKSFKKDIREKIIENRIEKSLERFRKSKDIIRDYSSVYLSSIIQGDGVLIPNTEERKVLSDPSSNINNICKLEIDYYKKQIPCMGSSRFQARLLRAAGGPFDVNSSTGVEAALSSLFEKKNKPVCNATRLTAQLNYIAFMKNEKLKADFHGYFETVFEAGKADLVEKCKFPYSMEQSPKNTLLSYLPESMREEANKTFSLSMSLSPYVMSMMASVDNFCGHFNYTKWSIQDVVEPSSIKSIDAIGLIEPKETEKFELGSFAADTRGKLENTLCRTPLEEMTKLLCVDANSLDDISNEELQQAASQILNEQSAENEDDNLRIALSSAACDLGNSRPRNNNVNPVNQSLDDIILADKALNSLPEGEIYSDKGSEQLASQCNFLGSNLEGLNFASGIFSGDGFVRFRNQYLRDDRKKEEESRKGKGKKQAPRTISQIARDEFNRVSSNKLKDQPLPKNSVTQLSQEDLKVQVQENKTSGVEASVSSVSAEVVATDISEPVTISPATEEDSASQTTSMDQLSASINTDYPSYLDQSFETNSLGTSSRIPTSAIQETLIEDAEIASEVQDLENAIVNSSSGLDASDIRSELLESIKQGQVTSELQESIQSSGDDETIKKLQEQVASLTQQVQEQTVKREKAEADARLVEANNKIKELEETVARISSGERSVTQSDLQQYVNQAIQNNRDRAPASRSIRNSEAPDFDGDDAYQRARNRALEQKNDEVNRVASLAGNNAISLVATPLGGANIVNLQYQNQNIPISKENLVISNNGVLTAVQIGSEQVPVDQLDPEAKESIEKLLQVEVAAQIQVELQEVQQERIQAERDSELYSNMLRSFSGDI